MPRRHCFLSKGLEEVILNFLFSSTTCRWCGLEQKKHGLGRYEGRPNTERAPPVYVDVYLAEILNHVGQPVSWQAKAGQRPGLLMASFPDYMMTALVVTHTPKVTRHFHRYLGVLRQRHDLKVCSWVSFLGPTFRPSPHPLRPVNPFRRIVLLLQARQPHTEINRKTLGSQPQWHTQPSRLHY